MLLSEYTSLEQKISEHIKKSNSVELFSRHEDARMFLGDFGGARKDYRKMIQLEPSLEVSHWRLRITYFYLGLFKIRCINLRYIISTMPWTVKMEFGDS